MKSQVLSKWIHGLPFPLMNDGEVVSVADSEQRLGVSDQGLSARLSLCGVNSTRSFQHTPFLNVHHRVSCRQCSIRANSISRIIIINRLCLSTF